MHRITRRRFIGTGLVTAGAMGVAPGFASALRALGLPAQTPSCTLTPEQEVGPFYVPGEMTRGDIAEGKPGVPLALRIVILDARTCKPIENAAIDLWHCDAMGVYSGYTKSNMGMGPGGPGGPGGGPPNGGPPNGGMRPDGSAGGPPPMGGGPGDGGGEFHGPPTTDKLTFLRGIQITDANGGVNFTTVFPGFYQGRTNHIHFKVRLGDSFSSFQSGCCSFGKVDNPAGHVSHNGQIFFPEEIATELMKHEPYSAHTIHRVTQSEDGVFTRQHGDVSIAKLAATHGENFGAGMSASIVAIVDPTATPKVIQPGPLGGFGGPGGPPQQR